MREAEDAHHGSHVLALPPDCAAFADETDFDDTLAVRFDLFASRSGGVPEETFYMFAFLGDDVLGELVSGPATDSEGGWMMAASDCPMSTADAIYLQVTDSEVRVTHPV